MEQEHQGNAILAMMVLMKRLLILLLLLIVFMPLSAHAQVNPQQGHGAPTGVCLGPYVDTDTGNLYVCKIGQYALAGGGSGSTPGTFLNGQQFDPFIFKLTNGGTCNPTVGITQLNTIQGFPGTTWSDGLASCIDIPAGANLVTNGQEIALSGYAINRNSSNQGVYGGQTFAVGVNGLSYCKANNTECEGIVADVTDDAGVNTNVILVGIESGVFPQNVGNTYYGFLFSPFSTIQPTTMQAFMVGKPIPGNTALATSGFECDQGAVLAVSGFYASCMKLGPVGSGATKLSSAIEFDSTTTGSVRNKALLLQATDSTTNGAYLRYTNLGAQAATIPTLPDPAGTNGLAPQQNLTFATCTLVAGTCTYTFINPYNAAQTIICNATGQATANALKAPATNASVVVTSSSGADTQAVSIVCGPRAN